MVLVYLFVFDANRVEQSYPGDFCRCEKVGANKVQKKNNTGESE